jgi:hypothetical protein
MDMKKTVLFIGGVLWLMSFCCFDAAAAENPLDPRNLRASVFKPQPFPPKDDQKEFPYDTDRNSFEQTDSNNKSEFRGKRNHGNNQLENNRPGGKFQKHRQNSEYPSKSYGDASSNIRLKDELNRSNSFVATWDVFVEDMAKAITRYSGKPSVCALETISLVIQYLLSSQYPINPKSASDLMDKVIRALPERNTVAAEIKSFFKKNDGTSRSSVYDEDNKSEKTYDRGEGKKKHRRNRKLREN